MAIKYEDRLYLIKQFTHVTPGNLRAFVQVKLRDLSSGSLIDKRLRSGEEVEQITLDTREMEYLYREAGGYVFMDTENYDQITLTEELVGDSMPYVKPNTKINVMVADGRPVGVELPKVVELAVVDTPPGIKGATVTNQLKDATLETGLVVRVPPFIGVGEVVRISTDDGSYNSRA